jgi:DNA modification methylase
MSRAGATHFLMLDRRLLAELMALATAAYGAPSDVVAWVKPSPRKDSPYLCQHELIGVFRICGPGEVGGEQLQQRRSRSNVWHYADIRVPAGNRGSLGSRRAAKPVALVADAIEDCTGKGDVVLDIFSGWGSTVMAAEQVGRHARALETDPRLIDATIRRWQAGTHGRAVHAASGLTFDEMAAANVQARAQASDQARRRKR